MCKFKLNIFLNTLKQKPCDVLVAGAREIDNGTSTGLYHVTIRNQKIM